MKPKVFNIGKAQREIEELQGKVIRLSLELDHYRQRNTPMSVDYDGVYRCPKCGISLCESEEAKEIIIKEGKRSFCPDCGQRVSWEKKEWNTSNFTD